MVVLVVCGVLLLVRIRRGRRDGCVALRGRRCCGVLLSLRSRLFRACALHCGNGAEDGLSPFVRSDEVAPWCYCLVVFVAASDSGIDRVRDLYCWATQR